MRYLILIYLTTVAVALLVIFGAFEADGAAQGVQPSTTPIAAVQQATAQYGWPHRRTFTETVAIPLGVRKDFQHAVDANATYAKLYRVGAVTCYWPNLRQVKPKYCLVPFVTKVPKRYRNTVYRVAITAMYEDGSYSTSGGVLVK